MLNLEQIEIILNSDVLCCRDAHRSEDLENGYREALETSRELYNTLDRVKEANHYLLKELDKTRSSFNTAYKELRLQHENVLNHLKEAEQCILTSYKLSEQFRKA